MNERPKAPAPEPQQPPSAEQPEPQHPVGFTRSHHQMARALNVDLSRMDAKSLERVAELLHWAGDVISRLGNLFPQPPAPPPPPSAR